MPVSMSTTVLQYSTLNAAPILPTGRTVDIHLALPTGYSVDIHLAPLHIKTIRGEFKIQGCVGSE